MAVTLPAAPGFPTPPLQKNPRFILDYCVTLGLSFLVREWLEPIVLQGKGENAGRPSVRVRVAGRKPWAHGGEADLLGARKG